MPRDDDYDDTEYLSDPEEEIRQDTLPVQEAEPTVPRTPRKATTEEKIAATLPIGQAETERTMHGLVKVTRSLSLGSRNDQIHVGCEHPYIVQEDWSLAQQAIAVADAMGVAKSTVFTQLGLDHTITEEGVIMEVLRAFPGTEHADDRGRDDEPRRGSNGHGSFPHPRDLDRPGHIDREVWDDLVEHYDDWYDNRKDKASGKYKDTAPDFKRAEDSETIWLRPYRRESSRSARR